MISDEKISEDEKIIDINAEDMHSVTDTEFEEYINPSANNDEPENAVDRAAALWQYKPIPADEPEPYEEYISSHSENGGIKITGARVRGKKHKHDGTNCDDWYETAVSGNWTIAAVSDGAGSKKFSRIGAMESCKAAVTYIKEKLDATPSDMNDKLSLPMNEAAFMEGCSYFAAMIQDAVDKAYEAVKAAYEERKTKFEYLKLIDRDLEFKDFSGTLLLCIILPVTVEEHTEYFAAACQIGDGIICSVDRSSEFDKALRLLGTPDNGAYSGETDFLTSAAMRKKETLMSKTKIMRGKTSCIMLMSDGVADDYFPNSPELLRLFLDLELNGILKTPETVSGESEVSCENIPEPVSYPWVNDNEKLIPVQYTKRVAESTGKSLEELWNESSLIKQASLENFSTELPENSDERLLRWLDNYFERGSFDDRTLLILETVL